jgi:hypothetical protein
MNLQYIRSFRVFNIALFDLIGTFIGLYVLLTWLLPSRPTFFYISWVLVGALPLSVLSHYLFNIPTQLNYNLGLSEKPLRG